MADIVKTKKKIGRRLKRSVRRTLGTLFLVSALVVAAIPTDGFRTRAAATESDWGTLGGNWSSIVSNADNIPTVTSADRIYTTGDSLFQFAYVYPKGASSGNQVAVILGYGGGRLEDGRLTIPSKVNAYRKISGNLGTSGGITAVGKDGNFLFYQVITKEPVQDVSGNNIGVQDKIEYYPCYYDTRANWQTLELNQFYYYPTATPDNPQPDGATPVLTTDVNKQWIKNAEVWYIGNQYLTAGTDGNWKVAGTVDYANRLNGVFAGTKGANIVHLTVGPELSGIGDYAFFNCANLESITLQNGLNTIGVGAFANCIMMETANIEGNAAISVIGDYAFYSCEKLASFQVPTAVTTIGSSAFENCYKLKNVAVGVGGSSLLERLGENVFRKCENLESLTFPRRYTSEVDISIFKGCSGLKFIAVPENTDINFKGGTGYTFENFKADVRPDFYFQGVKDSKVHTTATTNQIAFSFYDTSLEPPRDVYELTKVEDGKKVVYRVDDNDNLVYCNMESGMKTVTLPETIGPNNIVVIDSQTFRGNHHLEKITIPASITSIESNAFRGCHNLKYVIFTNPAGLESIGDSAFKTQLSVNSDDSISHPVGVNCPNSGDYAVDKNPELSFVGPVSYESVPFDFAMRASENINNGNQERTYIKYLSGWPTHLEVQYNPETDKNELVGYPTLNDIVTKKYIDQSTYPYMTDDYVKSMTEVVSKISGVAYDSWPTLDDNEKMITDAAMNLYLPAGIESIKENLYRDKEKQESSGLNLKKAITAESLRTVDDGAFAGCLYLTSVKFSDNTEAIGKYAFDGCKELTNVTLPGTVSKMGLRPFKDCEKLSTVNFSGGPYFVCEKGIIYELDSDGAKTKIVQCLKGRSNPIVTADETRGVKEIYQEAFMGNPNVLNIDLSDTDIEKVPEYAFAYTPELSELKLPNTVRSVLDNAFKNSNLRILNLPGMYQQISNYAFGDGKYDISSDDDHLAGEGDATDTNRLTMVVEEGSSADIYAKDILGITPNYQEPDNEYTVSFYGDDGSLLETQTVKQGHAAVPPTPPEVEGKEFLYWRPDTYKEVLADIPYVQAIYEKKDVVIIEHTVTFVDDDEKNTVLSTQTVKDGGNVILPQSPSKEGYTFKGWKGALTNITRDETVYAYYEKNSGSGGDGSGSGNQDPNNPSGSGSQDPNNPNGGTQNTTFYTLTVKNGSGSGSYVAGSQPVISANEPASGQEFSHWTIDPSNTPMVSKTFAATVLTMPAANVTVTAHYKAKTGSSTVSGNASSNNSNRPNGGAGTISSGTTVVIDKNGLSNTGVVSATVNGSSDNFTIKITESSAATEAILRALQAEYGNDLSDIKYFPMDISLYDSTGTRKITDTTGLRINVTLPLPDSLIPYAGNNKVAGVVNERLDKLSPKFTTIDRVSCVTFTAEHFSPYVIYVDTSRLSEGNVADSTPKTGDGIHPKWFLSIGLACMALVMFLQKDNRQKVKVKAKVRSGRS